MALWTPYSEQPLDLSRKTEEVPPVNLTEALYPSPYHVIPASYMYGLGVPTYVPAPLLPSPPQSVTVSPPYSVTASPPQASSASPFVISPQMPELQDSLTDDEEYQAYERVALPSLLMKNGESLLKYNPQMRRTVQTNEVADERYTKHREKNNVAAKQSRDRRKAREIRNAVKLSFLKKKRATLEALLAEKVCVCCQQRW